jgi:hypothetical protein
MWPKVERRMTSRRTILPVIVAIGLVSAALTACSTTEKLRASGDAIAVKEQQQMAALKQRYKDVITGTDVKGETLVVYVDVNNLYSMDEPAEDAMKAEALARWKRVWSTSHSGKHAKLTVVLHDYYGNEIFKETTRA